MTKSAGASCIVAAVLWLVAVPASAQSVLPLAPSDEAAGAAAEALLATGSGARPAPAATPRPVVQASPLTLLRSVTIAPSGLIAQAELDRVAQRWERRRIRDDDLGALLHEIQMLYQAQGHGFAEPVLARFDQQSGAVHIALHEPRPGVFRSASPEISDAYLAFRLNLDPDRPIDTQALAARLELLALSDDMRIDAAPAPSDAPDRMDFDIALSGAPARSGFISLDNHGRANTGRTRLSFGYAWRSLTGWNDPLSVSLTLLDGGYNAALSYARTVTPDGARVSVMLDSARSRTKAAPVVRNTSYGGEIGLSLPLVLRETHRLGVSASVLGFAERGSTVGVPTLSQRGHGVRLDVNGLRRGEGWFVTGGLGVEMIRWRDVLAGERHRHSAVLLSLAAARQVSGLVLSAQASAQIASAPAPARHRFTVAGQGAVRGYDTTGGSDDSGYFLRLQAEAAKPFAALHRVEITPFAFFDTGRSYAHIGGRLRKSFNPSSVGVGASFRVREKVFAEAGLARQLEPAPGATRRKTQISARLSYGF